MDRQRIYYRQVQLLLQTFLVDAAGETVFAVVQKTAT